MATMSSALKPTHVSLPARPPPAAVAGVSSAFSVSALTLSSEWSSPEFDAKAWINQQLDDAVANGKGTAVAADDGATTTHAATSDLVATTNHLSSLLMKLNLLSADLNSTMEMQSQELVQAMPK